MCEEDLRNLMFGDYMNKDLDFDERVYEEVSDLEEMYEVAHAGLEEYNNTHKTGMSLVIFKYVTSWLHCSWGGKWLHCSGGWGSLGRGRLATLLWEDDCSGKGIGRGRIGA